MHVYMAEGEYTKQRTTESFRGQHGLSYGGRQSVGYEHIVKYVTDKWKAKGEIPENTPIIAIDSPERKNLFSNAESHQFIIPKLKMPDLDEVLNSAIAENEEILDATVKVWKEHRTPLPFAYTKNIGELIMYKQFDGFSGEWEDVVGDDFTCQRVQEAGRLPITPFTRNAPEPVVGTLYFSQ